MASDRQIAQALTVQAPQSRGAVSVREFGALGNGGNDGVALQAALNSGVKALLIDGTFGTTQSLSVPPGVSIYGLGEQSVIRALSGFPATFNAGGIYTAVPAPILWRDGRTVNDKHDVYRDFRLHGGSADGSIFAPVGFLFTGGAQQLVSSVHTKWNSEAGIVLDGLQNSTFVMPLCSRSTNYNFMLLNGAAENVFVNLECRAADVANFYAGADASYPNDTTFYSGSPTDNLVLGGIFEHSFLGTRTRIAHVEDAEGLHFSRVQFVASTTVSTCGIEIGTASALVKIDGGAATSNATDEIPALINRGFRTVVQDVRFINWGSSTLTHLIQMHATMALIRPHEGGNNYTTAQVNVVAGSLVQEQWP